MQTGFLHLWKLDYPCRTQFLQVPTYVISILLCQTVRQLKYCSGEVTLLPSMRKNRKLGNFQIKILDAL